MYKLGIVTDFSTCWFYKGLENKAKMWSYHWHKLCNGFQVSNSFPIYCTIFILIIPTSQIENSIEVIISILPKKETKAQGLEFAPSHKMSTW